MYLYFLGLGNQLSKVLTLLFSCAAMWPHQISYFGGKKSPPICCKPLKSNSQNVSGLRPGWNHKGLNISLQLELALFTEGHEGTPH